MEAVQDLTRGQGCEVTADASGAAAGHATGLVGTRSWARCVLVGEGGRSSST